MFTYTIHIDKGPFLKLTRVMYIKALMFCRLPASQMLLPLLKHRFKISVMQV